MDTHTTECCAVGTEHGLVRTHNTGESSRCQVTGSKLWAEEYCMIPFMCISEQAKSVRQRLPLGISEREEQERCSRGLVMTFVSWLRCWLHGCLHLVKSTQQVTYNVFVFLIRTLIKGWKTISQP